MSRIEDYVHEHLKVALANLKEASHNLSCARAKAEDAEREMKDAKHEVAVTQMLVERLQTSTSEENGVHP